MITIYKITNPQGKVYIGQTSNYKNRLNHYRILNCKSQKKLYNSLKKYGFDKHTFEIIEEVSHETCDIREQYWINHYKSYWKDKNKGLNLNRGGFRPKPTKETKNKISKSLMGSKNIKAKKLYQYNIDGIFIKEWLCINDIQRELGYATTWLSKAAKNNRVAYGYKWSYTSLHN